MTKRNQEPVSSIPDDIIFNILSWLPVKSLLRFRCVCKPWCNLISYSNPNFVKKHLNHAIENSKFNLMLLSDSIYSIDFTDSSSSACYEAVDIDYTFRFQGYEVCLGSCNGLLCTKAIGVGGESIICLWNPSTKEFKEIITPHDEFPGGLGITHSRIVYGFGFDTNIEDYKLVRIVSFYRTDYEYGCNTEICYACEVKVYTLGSNSWKSIPYTIPYNLTDYYFCLPGVLVNGALHWIATNRIGGDDAFDAIVSFVIGDERFTEVPQLEHLEAKFNRSLSALGGCLCVLGDCHLVGVEVWVMKDYGVRESWTKLFSIADQSLLGSIRYVKPIWSFKNGKILLDFLSENHDYSLVIYDLEHERVKFLKIRSDPKCWSATETYVESLVSLNSGTYVGGANGGKKIEHTKKLKKRKKDN